MDPVHERACTRIFSLLNGFLSARVLVTLIAFAPGTACKKSFQKNTNSFDKEWEEFGKIMTIKNISRKECLLLPLNTTLDALNKKSL